MSKRTDAWHDFWRGAGTSGREREGQERRRPLASKIGAHSDLPWLLRTNDWPRINLPPGSKGLFRHAAEARDAAKEK